MIKNILRYYNNSKIKSNNSILVELISLAIPVIASSFLLLTYNFIDLIFVGKIGQDAIASVGSAGFYLHLGWAVSSLITIGAGIKVSHAIGSKNNFLAKSYVKSGFIATLVLSAAYFLILVIGRKYLIGFYKLNNPIIESNAIQYLVLAGAGLLFAFQNFFFSSVFIGYGDTKITFRINVVGVLMNIALDPIFMFSLDMGVQGAAVATILSQAVVTILYLIQLRKNQDLCPCGIIFKRTLLKQILSLGANPALQRVAFTIIAIILARIISDWGAIAIAVQKVGLQIEAIVFMTAGGLSMALSTYSGQAYGAKDYKKQWNGFKAGLSLAVIVGLVSSALFILFPEALFSLFVDDTESLAMGKDYVVILGYSQLFMCIEMVTTGAFYGWGKTNTPAIISIALTFMRIPLALYLINKLNFNLNGIWWSITISSIMKGTILSILFILLFKSFFKNITFDNYESKKSY